VSEAGRRASHGYLFQLNVALNWCVRLLVENNIATVEIEANYLDDGTPVSVDDILIEYRDGKRHYVQAKKNEIDQSSWKLSNRVLSQELISARDQLESDPRCTVSFVSQTPFGLLQKLVEEIALNYETWQVFRKRAGQRLRKSLSDVARIWKRRPNTTFELLSRLSFGSHHTIQEWNSLSLVLLKNVAPQPEAALAVIREMAAAHQVRLRGTSRKLDRKSLAERLEQAGLVLTPPYLDQQLIEEFSGTADEGAVWPRRIGSHALVRRETSEIVDAIKNGSKSLLVTGRPGVGKTCVLLDVVDELRAEGRTVVLLRGDHFMGDTPGAELPLATRDKIARLAKSRPVALVIDSLDVIALTRGHAALARFIALVDLATRMANINVVVACRSFDLQYDPVLRERKWDAKVEVRALSYDAVVVPLLNALGFDTSSVHASLKDALTIPQNLRLLASLNRDVDLSSLTTPYELQRSFLRHVVEEDSSLGPGCVLLLERIAVAVSKQRNYFVSLETLRPDATKLPRLASKELIVMKGDHLVGFAHQTLWEALVVRSAIAEGKSLTDFVEANPPFPFVRPAVRAFFLFVRGSLPNHFSAQVRQLVSATTVAYHLKRLVVESLSDIKPSDDDWPLIRFLFQNHPELFKRFFWRASSTTWFRFLEKNWFPLVLSDQVWRVELLQRVEVWANDFPNEAVALWLRAIRESWLTPDRAAAAIAVQMRGFKGWTAAGVPDLVAAIVQHSASERHSHFAGAVVSQYVLSSSDDALLWRYITAGITDEDTKSFHLGGKLRCDPHEFHKETFLAERLQASTELLTLAIAAIESWSASRPWNRAERLNDAFLSESAWHHDHTHVEHHHVDDLGVLISGVHSAIAWHASTATVWWQRIGTNLRGSVREAALWYALICAYRDNAASNLAAIAEVITRSDVLGFSRLYFELGQLTLTAYPLLDITVHEEHQRRALKIYSEEGEDNAADWIQWSRAQVLCWVPCCFQIPESTDLLRRFDSPIRYGLRSPDVHMRGGFVSPPVGASQLLDLTSESLERLIDHYGTSPRHGWGEDSDGRLVGGGDMLTYEFQKAAAIDLAKFMPLCDSWLESPGRIPYAKAVALGASDHLQYRFGNLKAPDGWSARNQPEGSRAATWLLHVVRRLQALSYDDSLSHAIDGILDAVQMADQSDEILDLLELLRSRSGGPDHDEQVVFTQGKNEITDHDLISQGINSARGRLAEASLELAARFIEAERDIPDRLLSMLQSAAGDKTSSVRAALLARLPYLSTRGWNLGHQLLITALEACHPHLWRVSERTLYYAYHKHFEDVAPILGRMQKEAGGAADECWARLMSLTHLDGRIDFESWMQQLVAIDSNAGWKGAADVYSANVGDPACGSRCEGALAEIILHAKGRKEVMNEIDTCFDSRKHGRRPSYALAKQFMQAVSVGADGDRIYWWLNWLGEHASRNPSETLELLEIFAGALPGENMRAHFWHSEPLIAALVATLREADESDDAELISRTIKVQDKLLACDLHGLEKLYE
jgi:hypothetical protein